MITQEVFDDQPLLQLSEELAPEIEIDSVPDELGLLYRVWNGSRLLGTFYQNLEGKWIAQPCNSIERPFYDTPLQAQLLIMAVNGLLVADAA
jgi:hypothetical protein